MDDLLSELYRFSVVRLSRQVLRLKGYENRANHGNKPLDLMACFAL
jgi:hypothetical protein